jgi:hypothetical protein
MKKFITLFRPFYLILPCIMLSIGCQSIGKTYQGPLLSMDKTALFQDLASKENIGIVLWSIDEKKVSSRATYYALRPGRHKITFLNADIVDTSGNTMWSGVGSVDFEFEAKAGHRYLFTHPFGAGYLYEPREGTYLAKKKISAGTILLKDVTNHRDDEGWREMYKYIIEKNRVKNVFSGE